LSPEFAGLRESTQREYKRMLTRVEAAFGTMPLAALEDPRVRQDFMKWRATVANASGNREADNRLSVLSAMISWAKENGLVFSNHIAGFRRLHHADRSDKIWLPEHITAFMKVAPVEMQRALIMALHTGQRQGDLLQLAWTNYDGTLISLRQGKGGRKVEIPCTRALTRMLQGIARESTVILTTKTGRPWKARYFKAQWEAVSVAAGVTDLHFHDLRGTAVTMLAEAGCTTPQIAAITGHSLKTVTTILDKYLARTRVLASEAVSLFENARSTEFANRLQTEAAIEVRQTTKPLK
jgi:integrase